ncbi:hypothetical protein J437_LFUL007735 [Ladona fulva]|uniref:Uncharacterized protein n=1 Tax=Ladona fulva TaxID=123851 RepID=A0A8K0P388_LADFU|nr:hypothetical protein J437_LFUL007735 [Ladona fulva]
MAKTLRSYIIITFVVCCVSFAILVTSISTTSWVTAKLIGLGDAKYEINYGLFLGTLTDEFFLTPKLYTIELACITSENVCAWSCKPTADERQQDVNLLYYDVEEAIDGCGVSALSKSHLGRMREEWDDTTEPSSSSTVDTIEYKPDKRFVNLGVWGATCTSLVISIILSGIGAVGAVVNTAANPVHTIAAVPGLYLWNGLAAFFGTLALILWGSLYAAILRENVAVHQTITGECKGISSLGFSF